MLWIVLAILTALVAAILLYPLSRRGDASAAVNAEEVEVYRDQMKELERDKAQGLISGEDAEYARAEIGRRLLAAAGQATGAPVHKTRHGVWRSIAVGTVTVVPPALGLCLYIALGNPGLPDQPLEARLENPGNDLQLLVAKAERHLAQSPDDGAGWDILAPIYLRSNRVGDAEMAFRNAIRLLGPTANRLSGLGETLVSANDGIVTEDARSAFEEAARLEPENMRAHFYVALGLEQAGRTADARAAFEAIAKASPADAPWLGLIDEHIRKNGGQDSASSSSAAGATAPGNPTAEDVAAAEDLSQDDRQAMVRGMVDSLAARLEADPANIEGWLRLVRSYMVLGERDKATAALQSGLTQFPAEGTEGQQLAALARELGLASAVEAPRGVTQ